MAKKSTYIGGYMKVDIVLCSVKAETFKLV